MPVYYLTLISATGLAWLANSPRPGRPNGPRGRIPQLALLAGAILAFVAALRWHVGTDYWTYSRLYSDYVQTSLMETGLLGEPGLPAIAQLSRLVHNDYATMFAIAAIATVALFVATIWRFSPIFPVSIALFVLLGTWQGTFNGVRQYLAAAIIFAGQKLILERRLGAYTLTVLLAALFHVSALLCLAFYFVPRRRLSLATSFLLAIGSISILAIEVQFLDLIGSFKDPSATDRLSQASYAIETLHPLRVALAFVPILVYAFVANKERLRSEDYYYINMLFINAAIWVAASGSAYLARFAIYSSMYLVVAIPRLIASIDSRWRLPWTAGILLTYGVFWYLNTAPIVELANFQWIFARP